MTVLSRFCWLGRTAIRRTATTAAAVVLLLLAALSAGWFFYRAAVQRGGAIERTLSRDEGRLLGGGPNSPGRSLRDRPAEAPMPFARVTKVLELTPGKADFLEFTVDAIIRRDGLAGRVVWDTAAARSSYGPGRDPGQWLRAVEPGMMRVSFVEPAVDLDGDGTRDVVVVEDGRNTFIALSGKDGSMLWKHAAERPRGGRRVEVEERPGAVKRPTSAGVVVGWSWIDDIDGDGVAELVATMIFAQSPARVANPGGSPPLVSYDSEHAQRVVQAISGRTGRRVWSFAIDPTLTTIRARYWNCLATLLHRRRASTLSVLDGSRWITIDPRTGLPTGDLIHLGREPVRPVQ